MMNKQVFKFGGTSVAGAEQIKKVAAILIEELKSCPKVVVVVSAMGGITDQLIGMGETAQNGDRSFDATIQAIKDRHIEAASELLSGPVLDQYLVFLQDRITNLGNILLGVYLTRELTPRMLDVISSFGELVSSRMIASYLNELNGQTGFIDSRKVIHTDETHGAAKVDFAKTNKSLIAVCNDEKPLYIMGGFISSSEAGITTTLGRGGSDYTAAIVASALDVDVLQIWTDVDGVMTADPRRVKRAFTLSAITYEEAMEMSHFGAKVIHPPTIQPVLRKNIPVRIRNTFNPAAEGTYISKDRSDADIVKGISSIAKVALLNIQGSGLMGATGMAGRVFSCLAQANVNIILITQASSEYSITLAISPASIPAAKQALSTEFDLELEAGIIDEPIFEEGLSIVAIVGSKMKSTTGISSRLFHALGSNGINVYAIAQGSSELNISAVVSEKDATKAVSALHQAFFDSDTKTINLFAVGVGLIGGTLLKQIETQVQYLKEKHQLEFRLVGAANSKKMLFNKEGIPFENWKEELSKSEESTDLTSFHQKMEELNLPNSVYLDNTASDLLVPFYASTLKNSIHIVTPNKVANAGSIENYHRYRALAKKHGVHFLYETNVGAGLPVISTLRDLLRSGDSVKKIEAVLSGSLSFIFNNFVEGSSFSAIVQQARELGFTEPDPRVDLSGTDVARKALILAREMGQEIELSDIKIKGFLPAELMDAADADSFMNMLPAFDDYFEGLRKEAAAENKALRFMASVGADNVEVGVQAVTEENPFYSLRGSDNLILFSTDRYLERPMVICGPGAGADVTAAGVFAELIGIGNYISA
ncbi:bifunctional aspartate kinase/homoserine dehydrogenase I [Chitinophagales bacterium]|nr:bifunctional aspartate kinase/homoserine dehydrogenase I [Chitinophagales bacterium]